MSSSMWSVASIKKSILFDVLSVMDRANRITSSKIMRHEYSLLKADTVKKYDALYKVARNQSELMVAAFYVSKKNIRGKHDTIIVTYLLDKAMEMVSFNEMIKFLEKSTAEDIAYYIATMCLSTKDEEISREQIDEIVKQGDMKLIEVLNETTLPEKVKMSVYMIIFNYEEFLSMLIHYMKNIYNCVYNLYLEYSCIYKTAKKALIHFLRKNTESSFLIQDVKKKVNDEKQRKKVFILSLIRLEHGWINQNRNFLYYSKGIFAIQRIIHNSDFTVF